MIDCPNPDCDAGIVTAWDAEGTETVCSTCGGLGMLEGQAAEDQIEREKADDERNSGN